MPNIDKQLNIFSQLGQRMLIICAYWEIFVSLHTQGNIYFKKKNDVPIIRYIFVVYLNPSLINFWRNDDVSKDHHFLTFKGHSAESDFIDFSKSENILFESDLM